MIKYQLGKDFSKGYMTTIIIILIAEMISLSALLWHKNYQHKKRSLVFKTITSLLFLYIAIHAFVFVGQADIFEVFVITALFFCLLGDVLICFIRKKLFFKLAGVSFFIGHIVYSIGFYYESGIFAGEIITIVILWFLFPLAVNLSKINIKKYYVMVYAYYMLLVTMMVKAVAFLIGQPYGLMNGLLIALGGFLFFVSDIIIFFEKFNKECRRRLFIPNLITYYIGQTLIACSLLFIK